jgi:hypothetical protein
MQHKNFLVSKPLIHFSKSKPFIQPKLTINEAGDIYEQEADAMANRILRMSSYEAATLVTGLIGKSLQRKCAHCEEDEKRRKPVMRKAEAGSSGMSVSSSFASSLNATKGGGAQLPQGMRSFMENAFSADFSDIRIHSDSQASEMSKGINARAFTHGNDIYFGEGQYNPFSNQGRYLLAHELTHTMQQNAPASEGKIKRFISTEPAGGCGLCYGLPREAGRAAHTLIQTEFEIMYPLGLIELPLISGGDDNGRLDLAVATPTGLEIGEIKPANAQGYADGITQIATYVALLNTMFPNRVIRPLTRLIPPIIFPTLSADPGCEVQELVVNPPVGGVYGYWCYPGFSQLMRRGCRCYSRNPRRQEQRDPIPVPVPQPQNRPVPVRRTMWNRISDFATEAIRSGQTADAYIQSFLLANPELINYIIAVGVAGLVATFAEDIATLGVGILDDLVTVPFFAAMIRIALALRPA